jgi:hypothetical protein
MNNKAIALNKLGKYEEDLNCFDKLLELDTNNNDNWCNKNCPEKRYK